MTPIIPKADEVRVMSEHELKTWPNAFQAMKRGEKTFEFRKDDRFYQVGDVLWLREWDPATEVYTGDEMRVIVRYILSGGKFGMPFGFVVMSVTRAPSPAVGGEIASEMAALATHWEANAAGLYAASEKESDPEAAKTQRIMKAVYRQAASDLRAALEAFVRGRGKS